VSNSVCERERARREGRKESRFFFLRVRLSSFFFFATYAIGKLLPEKRADVARNAVGRGFERSLSLELSRYSAVIRARLRALRPGFKAADIICPTGRPHCQRDKGRARGTTESSRRGGGGEKGRGTK
jgi:hypothetical protein